MEQDSQGSVEHADVLAQREGESDGDCIKRVVDYMEESDLGCCFMLCQSRYGGTYAGGDWVAHFGVNPEGVVRLLWGGDFEPEGVKDIPYTGIGTTMVEATLRAAQRTVRERAEERVHD